VYNIAFFQIVKFKILFTNYFNNENEENWKRVKFVSENEISFLSYFKHSFRSNFSVHLNSQFFYRTIRPTSFKRLDRGMFKIILLK